MLLDAALSGLRHIYQPGYDICKAGVILQDRSSAHQVPYDLPLNTERRANPRLMQALNAIDTRFGNGALTFGTTGTARTAKKWAMRQQHRTPHYTTSIQDIPTATA